MTRPHKCHPLFDNYSVRSTTLLPGLIGRSLQAGIADPIISIGVTEVEYVHIA